MSLVPTVDIAKIVKIKDTVFKLGEVRIIAKRVHSHIFQIRVQRKPCLRPKVAGIISFLPSTD